MSIKQAIEALALCVGAVDENIPCEMAECKQYQTDFNKAAVEKGRAALAALRSMPAEPVAWVRFCGDGLYEGPVMNCDKTRMENVRHKISEWTALYATPHTEAVLLTDAEIDAITLAQWGDRVLPAAHRAYARAIEKSVIARVGRGEL